MIGAIAGAMAGAVLSKDAVERQAEEEQLDREIGVTEGDIGAPSLQHPPPSTGAFSGAATGVSSTGGGGVDDDLADGPIEPPPS